MKTSNNISSSYIKSPHLLLFLPRQDLELRVCTLLLYLYTFGLLKLI